MSIPDVKFIKARYIPSSRCLEQGFKGGSTPKGRYYGGNGTFVTVESPKYFLTFKDNSTGREFEKNCYYEVKGVLFDVGVERLTKKYRDLVEDMLRKDTFPTERLNLPCE